MDRVIQYSRNRLDDCALRNYFYGPTAKAFLAWIRARVKCSASNTSTINVHCLIYKAGGAFLPKEIQYLTQSVESTAQTAKGLGEADDPQIR